MIVNNAPCRSRATSRPSLNTYAAMKKPTTVVSMRSRTMSDFMLETYHQEISVRRKKD